MGNQSTSGIVEEKTANEATEEAREVSSPDCLEEENHVLIQEDKTKDFQENDETDKSPCPVERLTFGDNEEHKRSVDEDSEIRTDAPVNISSNHVESKGSNLEEEKSKLIDDVHGDKICNLNGEMETNNPDLEPKFASSMTKESVDITSEPQEDQTMMAEDIVETLEFINTTSQIRDCDVEMNKDDLVVKSDLLETCTQKEENGIDSERKSGDPLQEEQKSDIYPFDALHDQPSVSLQDSARNEENNEFLPLDDEKQMVNDLSNGGDQDQLEVQSNIKKIGVEIDSCLSVEEVDLVQDVKAEDQRNQIGRNNSIKSKPVEELKDLSDEETEVVKKTELVQTDQGLIAIVEDKENDNASAEHDQESETSTIKKCLFEPQSSSEISRVTEIEPTQNAEIPRSFSSEQHSIIETLKTENSKYNANLGYKGVRVELRKTSSFDFGVPFDAIRMSESDKTPLLYQDRTTAIRSFSSSSALKFQHRSVQTEYVQYDEVEEKTIRMERSSSDVTNCMNKKQMANNYVSHKKQLEENGLKLASPPREENGKRKPRSSLFTTCICCTATIS